MCAAEFDPNFGSTETELDDVWLQRARDIVNDNPELQERLYLTQFWTFFQLLFLAWI